MVNAQEWLDKEYPKVNSENKSKSKKRWRVKELVIPESLIGELDLEDFIELENIYRLPQAKEDELTIINKPEKVNTVWLSEVQDYLEQYYPRSGFCQEKTWSLDDDFPENFGRKRDKMPRLW